MKPVTQSRIGSDGRCFPACLASILELPEAQVPDLDNTDEEQVNAFLGQHGLRYQEMDIDDSTPIPVGWHIICGVSPRGGMHAVVGRDGAFVHDPHPVSDDPRRGVVKPERWGVLTPTKNSMEKLYDRRPNLRAKDGVLSHVKSLFSNPYAVEWTPEKLATAREIVGNLRETIRLIEQESPLTPERRREVEGYKRQAMEWQDIINRYGKAQPERRGVRDFFEPRQYKNKKTATGKATTNWHLRKKCAKCNGPVPNDARPSTWCQACLLESGYTRHGEMDARQKADVDRVRRAIHKAAEAELGASATDRADMMQLRRNTQKQGGPFHVQLTEPDGREHTTSTRALRAYDADLQPVPPYKPGQRVVLSNGKSTMVHKIALSENLLGEPEWHVLTTSGDYVTVKV